MPRQQSKPAAGRTNWIMLGFLILGIIGWWTGNEKDSKIAQFLTTMFGHHVNPKVVQFNDSVRQLNELLTRGGGDDLKVANTCMLVHGNFEAMEKEVKLTRGLKSEARIVAGLAKLYGLRLLKVQVGIAIGPEKRDEVVADVQTAQQTFRMLQSEVSSYLKNYGEARN